MNELDFRLETKGLDEQGLVEGLAAGYGNLDRGGDIMLRGSLSKSLSAQGEIPMLMYHKHDRPAGVWTDFKEVEGGLLVKGQLALGTQDGDQAFALLKRRALKGLSVGLNNVKAKFVGKSRHIHEADIHEISLVTVPMNQRTEVLSVKDIFAGDEKPTRKEFENFLREVCKFSKSEATFITTKGYAPLLRGEPGNDPATVFAAALAERLRS